MSEPVTAQDLIDLGERVLQDSTHLFDDHDNRLEAEQLLAFTLDIDHDDLNAKVEPSRRLRERYLSLIARRAGGEPFPFITGRIEFYGLDLKVKPGAFVPRPSSELTVDRALKRLKGRKKPVVIDVCAGAAPIALAIADEFPSADVWALEIDEEALVQGRSNARRLGIRNLTARASDMYSELPHELVGKVDVITGHVPYVPHGELEDMPTEVRDHEPIYTLTDQSADGLTLMRRAVQEGAPLLRPGGWLLLEVSDDLGKKIQKLYRKAQLEDHGVATDNDGLSIVVEGRKPPK
ncbi:MAG: release factor glutamine methyltransferase [Actinomycetota bacterium]|jgi:release factor glutamine methyltransferase|nr:release factor glutamine methyltransferase [Actinomycetota bacterium]